MRRAAILAIVLGVGLVAYAREGYLPCLIDEGSPFRIGYQCKLDTAVIVWTLGAMLLTAGVLGLWQTRR